MADATFADVEAVAAAADTEAGAAFACVDAETWGYFD